jgi:chromosome segregation ATPase
MPELKNLDVQWVSLVDRAAVRDPENQTEPMRFLVWKREHHDEGGHMTPEETRAALEKTEGERDELKSQLEKAQADSEEHKAALEKAQTDLNALTAKVSELTKDETVEEIDKSDLPPAVRERLEKAEADAQALAERLEKAEKNAASERDERLSKEFVTKAEAFKALPVKATEFGAVLKSASEKLSKDEYEHLEGVLKAADEQIAAGDLFKEQGRGGTSMQDGALAEATEKAQELRKADSTLSAEQALDRVFQNDRALQERYLAEVR